MEECPFRLLPFRGNDCGLIPINVRSAMCAASQLPGGEPTDVDDAPAR